MHSWHRGPLSVRLLTAVVGALLLAGCADGAAGSDPMPDGGASTAASGTSTSNTPISSTAEAVTSGSGDVKPLPEDGFDYQLGGAYAPPDGVRIVVRDRSEDPLEGGYSICYVNAFQTQPGEAEEWDEELLLSVDGKPVTDPDWPDETLLDTSTEAKREGIVKTVTPWIRGCADDGYDAVEFDNLDSYTRSGGALTFGDNAALAKELTAASHASGLAAAQKNLSEHAETLKGSVGFDLAVAEECAAYEECSEYTDAYGDQVMDIEYSDNLPEPFVELCTRSGTPSAMILRDRDLATPDEDSYVYRVCP